MKEKDIFIGTKIKQVLDESGMKIENFAKAINRHRCTVYHIFNQKSVDTELLISISDVLNYNFFNEYDYFKNQSEYKEKKYLITVEDGEKKYKITVDKL